MIERVYADTMEPLSFTYEPEETQAALFALGVIRRNLGKRPDSDYMSLTLQTEAMLIESQAHISTQLHSVLATIYLPRLLETHRDFLQRSIPTGKLRYAERCKQIGVSVIDLFENGQVAKQMLSGKHEIELVG